MQEGEFVAIIGENGAGKSTLLNCISGAYDNDAGTITLDLVDVSFYPEYKRSWYIGRVFQDPLRGTAFDMSNNMKAFLEFGTRTIMMHEGKIIMDLHGQERSKMTGERLIEQFGKRSGEESDNDRMLLSD